MHIFRRLNDFLKMLTRYNLYYIEKKKKTKQLQHNILYNTIGIFIQESVQYSNIQNEDIVNIK